MACWQDYVVVVFAKEFHIFCRPTAKNSHQPRFITALVRSDANGPANDAYFVEGQCSNSSQGSRRPGVNIPPLFVLMRCDKNIVACSLSQVRDVRGGVTFHLSVCSVPESEPSMPMTRAVPAFSVGPAFEYCLWTIARSDMTYLPPRLLLSRLHSPRVDTRSGIPGSFLGCTRYISTTGLPANHLLSCLDFDDARGVLLTGYSDGSVCLLHFVKQSMFEPGSLLDALPDVRHVPKIITLSKVSAL